MWFQRRPARIVVAKRESSRDPSVLSAIEVQRSLSEGAPATPWPLRREDHEAMDMLAMYFARAIPVPTDEGRVTIRESAGNGGPQLELYVPVLSAKNPIAVLARDWHADGAGLEASLFFFGAPDGRLAAIVSKLGFVARKDNDAVGVTVFQSKRISFRKRAS